MNTKIEDEDDAPEFGDSGYGGIVARVAKRKSATNFDGAC